MQTRETSVVTTARVDCQCCCRDGMEPWPTCSCGSPHHPNDPAGPDCVTLWESPWGCRHCNPDSGV